MNPNPALSVQGVTHRYGNRMALKDVRFEVSEGEIFALLGPNGGGKTTLFRIITTLMRATAGDAQVFGHSVRDAPHAVRKRIGVVFQQPGLDPKLTVLENMIHHGRLHGMLGSSLRSAADALLAQFGLSDRKKDYVETLSGGLQRRVELAKALLPRPEILFLDEPSTGLDPGARIDFRNELKRLRNETNTTVVLTTHFIEEADHADRVGVIHEGNLVAIGAPDALKKEVGGEVLTIEAQEPESLRQKLAEMFSCDVKSVDGSLRVEMSDAHAAIPKIAEAFPGEVRSITLGKPTLEDVFINQTGKRFTDADEDLPDPKAETMTPYLLCMGTIWQREIVRFVRQRSRIIGAFGQPILFWLLLGSGFGRNFRYAGGGGEGYLEYFYPGIIAMMVLFTAIFSTFAVVDDRKARFLQGVLAAPVPRSAIVLGQVMGGATLALLQGVLLLVATPLAGVPLTLEAALASILVMGLIGFALTALGLLLAWRIESTQGFHSIMNLLLIPLWVLSGAVFPVSGAHPLISFIMQINPLTYGVAALRRTLYLSAPDAVATLPGLWVSLLIMIIFGGVCFAFAVKTAEKSEG